MPKAPPAYENTITISRVALLEHLGNLEEGAVTHSRKSKGLLKKLHNAVASLPASSKQVTLSLVPLEEQESKGKSISGSGLKIRLEPYQDVKLVVNLVAGVMVNPLVEWFRYLTNTVDEDKAYNITVNGTALSFGERTRDSSGGKRER